LVVFLEFRGRRIFAPPGEKYHRSRIRARRISTTALLAQSVQAHCQGDRPLKENPKCAA